MKKILLLLLTAWKLSAGFMDDLEKGIMESNLSAVKKLLKLDISISGDDKIALINLAAEIIKKREDKVLLNSIIPMNGTQTYYRKFLDKNKELKAHSTNALIYSLAAAFSLVLAPAGAASKNVLLCIVAFAIGSLGTAAALYNLVEYINLQKRLIVEHDTTCKTRYDNAIQIRQLLYKIKLTSIK